MNMLEPILYGSLVSFLYAVGVTLAAWVAILLVLRKWNKYNVRNFSFWFLSVFLLPYAIGSLSLIISAERIQNRVVSRAQEYAMEMVIKINAFPHDVVNAASSYTHGKISDVVEMPESRIVEYAAEYAGSLADEKVDELAAKVDSLIPEDIISSIIAEFPSLEYFLRDHEILCSTDKEIVDSIFAIVNGRIDGFQRRIWKALLIPVAFFLAWVIFIGFLKKRRKERRAYQLSLQS